MKVGDYVRTKRGRIGKLINFIDEPTNYYFNCYETDLPERWGDKYITEYTDIKISPNIIDLIEVGDYINGLRVEANKYGELYTSYVYYGGDIGKQCEVYTTWLEEYKENEDYIDSILTKEQFESMEYKI